MFSKLSFMASSIFLDLLFAYLSSFFTLMCVNMILLCLFIFYLSFVQPWSTTFVFVVFTLNLSEHKFVVNWPPLTFTAKLNNQFRQKQCCFSFRELAKEDIKFQLKPHFSLFVTKVRLVDKRKMCVERLEL